jgi:hypothetical protein
LQVPPGGVERGAKQHVEGVVRLVAELVELGAGERPHGGVRARRRGSEPPLAGHEHARLAERLAWLDLVECDVIDEHGERAGGDDVERVGVAVLLEQALAGAQAA